MAGAALPNHGGPALTAKELCRQQVFLVPGLFPGRGFLVLRQTLLHPVKQVFGNDGGNSVLFHNIPVAVFPDIAAVVEEAGHNVNPHGAVDLGAQAPFVQVVHQ